MKNNSQQIIEDNSDDDEIVINDEYNDDALSIGSSLNIKHNHLADQQPTNLISSQLKKNTAHSQDMNTNPEEIETDNNDELAYTTQLIYPDKGVFNDGNINDGNTKPQCVNIESAIEDKYLSTINALRNEIKTWKESNSLLSKEASAKEKGENPKQNEEKQAWESWLKEKLYLQEEINALIKQKKEIEDYKSADKEQGQGIAQNKMTHHNEDDMKEIMKWKDKLKSSEINSDKLQKQLNETKKDANKLREELVEKNKIISELQRKLQRIEQEFHEKENTKSYEDKNRPSSESYTRWLEQYNEVQKQFNSSISEIHKLSEENAELHLQLLKSTNNGATVPLNSSSPSKTQVQGNSNINKGNIESKVAQKNTAATLTNTPAEPNLKRSNSKQFTNNQNSSAGNTNSNNISNVGNVNSPNKTGNQKQKTSRKKWVQIKPDMNQDYSPDLSAPTISPWQREIIFKQGKILEIEMEWYKLLKEKDKINDELLKLPEVPKQQVQIQKKNGWELNVEEFNNKINQYKIKLRELNSQAS